MRDFPFKVLESNQNIEKREFSSSLEHEELLWHRDAEDRLIRLVSGSGWFLQLDDQKPAEILPEGSHFVPAGVWHRLLKLPSATNLVILVLKRRVNETA